MVGESVNEYARCRCSMLSHWVELKLKKNHYVVDLMTSADRLSVELLSSPPADERAMLARVARKPVQGMR